MRFPGRRKCWHDLQYPGVGAIKKGAEPPEVIKKKILVEISGVLFLFVNFQEQ